MLKHDPSAISVIRSYFDEACYGYTSYRRIPNHDENLFPEFGYLQSLAKTLSSPYMFLFTLFRQGHSAEEMYVRKSMPNGVFEAMVDTGLLVQTKRGHWRTPSLAIVSVEGLYLAVSLPPHYPTAVALNQPIYIGFESVWLLKALPPRLNGQTVLDLCAGSGIQGLAAALRGASRVVCLEIDPDAVAVARFNASLNGFDDVVEVRESNLYSALQADEKFDLVTCNSPFMPVPADSNYPICGDGGVDGLDLLRTIVTCAPQHMTDRAQALFFASALGGQFSINVNADILSGLAREHSLLVQAYVTDKMPLPEYAEKVLRVIMRQVSPYDSEKRRTETLQAWMEELRRRGVPSDYVYSQVIRAKRSGSGRLENVPLYRPTTTDPLVQKVELANVLA